MKSRFRTIVFWAHLAVGVAAALFVVNMACSGILLAYEHDIIHWSERGQLKVEIPPGQPRLDVETLVTRAQQARPGARFFRMVHHADPAASVSFFDTGEDSTVLYLNPYTGGVVGDGQQGVRRFFHAVTGWHRWLSMEGESKQTGKTITGTVSLVFFGLLLSGLYLWLPRTWSKKSLGQIALFRRGLSGKARDWNWHNVVGIWCSPLILLTTFTGVMMSFAWAQGLLYRVSGEAPPAPRVQPARPKPGAAVAKAAAAQPSPKLRPAGLNPLLAVAETKLPGWKTIGIVLPKGGEAPVSFFLSGAGEGDARPDLSARLILARRTGAVMEWDPFGSHKTGRKMQDWMTPIHTGEVAGLFGQTLAVVGACGAILLAWTGLSLTWRRFFGGRRLLSVESSAAPAGPMAGTLPESLPG